MYTQCLCPLRDTHEAHSTIEGNDHD